MVREKTDADLMESDDGPRLLLIGGGVIILIMLAVNIGQKLRGDVRLLRNFYGVVKVKTYPPAGERPAVHLLLDGRISHGYQFGAPREREPTAYFVPESGIGQALQSIMSPRTVGVLGLGAGTLAVYAQPDDTFIFYELNPDVLRVAQEEFTYLKDAKGDIRVVLGDGRFQLAATTDTGFDCLVLDAFSGDAIPAHLLTQEAMTLYWSRINPKGVLAVNVSNRHADLSRVVIGHAQRMGLEWRRVRFSAPSPMGPYLSDWMLLSRHPQSLSPIEKSRGDAEHKTVDWRDDHAPLLPILTGI